MLGNLVVGSEKVVLFVDNNSYEPFAKQLLQNVSQSAQNIFYPKITNTFSIDKCFRQNIDNELLAVADKSNVILAPISKLELYNSVADIVQLVHYLKQSPKVKQIFIWCSIKNVQEDKLIPFLQYMSNIEVTLTNESSLSVLIKRNTGSVSRKEYQYSIATNFDISVREKAKTTEAKQSATPAIDLEGLSTFKITIGGGEQASRDALKLPYERTSTEQQVSRIHYEPDSDDDFDDEDPDEDLNI